VLEDEGVAGDVTVSEVSRRLQAEDCDSADYPVQIGICAIGRRPLVFRNGRRSARPLLGEFPCGLEMIGSGADL
jgi:hypothetical protein